MSKTIATTTITNASAISITVEFGFGISRERSAPQREGRQRRVYTAVNYSDPTLGFF